MGDLNGKVAFVTGGGSGIGRGICERLARDGADVFIADVDEDGADQTVNLVNQLGRRAHRMRANVASKANLQAAADACVAQFGRLDIAVANAGIGRGGSILDMALEDWQLQVDINLTGVFLTVQAAAQRMAKLGHGGRIVCISSLAAKNTGPGIWSYSATKVGVRMMVRGWAQELGPLGINVNAIGPGVIDTPLAAGLAGEADGVIRRNLERTTPVGRGQAVGHRWPRELPGGARRRVHERRLRAHGWRPARCAQSPGRSRGDGGDAAAHAGRCGTACAHGTAFPGGMKGTC